jgi:hypothetical protein
MNGKRLKGLYKMSGFQFWWFRFTRDGQRHAVPLRTPDEGIAVSRAKAILVEGLIAAADYAPGHSAPRKREIHGLVDLYLKDAQNRHKKALRIVTADNRRYVLNKFITDCSINRVSDVTLPAIQRWLIRLKNDGSRAPIPVGPTVKGSDPSSPIWCRDTCPRPFWKDSRCRNPRQSDVRTGFTKTRSTKIIEAAGDDLELKFALYCGFDAGLRRNEISEAKSGGLI